MLNVQDLPDELVLKILGYSETKDLIIYGQVSKRVRKISRDSTLWVIANLVKKIVKTELLEMILSKGCKILNLSNSTIVGSLSSNMKHNLRSLDLSQSTKPGSRMRMAYCQENTAVLVKLLYSCNSLQYLNMEGLRITPKMAASICKNGKTLQGLNLNHSYIIERYNALDYTVPNWNLQAIIKCCQELKELTFTNQPKLIHSHGLEFLAKTISPNVVKLNLSYTDVDDDNVKTLLRRCNKIKVLNLEATLITDDSLKTMRQYLNLTLEELSVTYNVDVLELKFMPRLKILNLHCKEGYNDQIQDLTQHLPHLMIRTFFDY